MKKAICFGTLALLVASAFGQATRGRQIKWNQVAAPDYLMEQVSITKGSTTVPGGLIQHVGTNQFIVYFNTGSSGGGGDVSVFTAVDVGMVSAWPGATNAIPDGWLLCDGAAYSTNTYLDLYNVIGFNYSSGAGTTFNVPDYRGVALVGVEGDRGLYTSTNRTASGYGMETWEVGSFQEAAYATTNDEEIVRLANTYVNWVIKYRDDNEYFVTNGMFQFVADELTEWNITNQNGLLVMNLPVRLRGSGPSTWSAPIYNPSGYATGDSGIQAASSLSNRTITAWATVQLTSGLIQASIIGIVYVYSVPIPVIRQSSVPPGSGLVGSPWIEVGITFDVPAGCQYRVLATDAATVPVLEAYGFSNPGSSMMIYETYKPLQY